MKLFFIALLPFWFNQSFHNGDLANINNDLGNQDSKREIRLLSGKLDLWIPADLNQESEAEIERAYPVVAQRPSYVFENHNQAIKFLINYGSSEATDRQLPQIKTYFENLYKHVGSDFISGELKVINKKEYAILKLITVDRTTGNKLFNFFFITTISQKLLIANYCFPVTSEATQQIQAMNILNSVKIKD